MATEIICKLLGNEVLSSDGASHKIVELCGEGKVIGLYFSANWCAPCRLLTPKLKELYNKLRSTTGNNSFEIIFISCDRDEKRFFEYFKTMPWLALPYGIDEAMGAMSKFCPNGIPVLVLVDGQTGKEITRKGQEELEKDPEGTNFPWRKA